MMIITNCKVCMRDDDGDEDDDNAEKDVAEMLNNELKGFNGRLL
jgi:hypothetical protein